MDLGFFRRDMLRVASRSATRLDYGVVVATLAAMQSTTPTARAVRSVAPQTVWKDASSNPLVELLLAGPSWRDALIVQRGSFNPAQALGHPGVRKPK